MRQTVLAVLAFLQLTLLLPPIWDRAMSAAPEWAWRALILAFAITTTALFLVSDLVSPRVAQPRTYPISSTLAVGLALAVVGGTAWRCFIAYAPPVLWSVVTVHPTTFVLHKADWSHATQLTITNTGTRPLFSVWLELASATPDVTHKIQWEVDRDPTSIKEKVGNVEIDSDVFALFGNSGGRDAVWIRFYRLLPNTPRTVKVSSGVPINSSGSAAIVGAALEPEPLVRRVSPPKAVDP